MATCVVVKSVNHIIAIRTLRDFYANDERVNASQDIHQHLSIQPSQQSPRGHNPLSFASPGKRAAAGLSVGPMVAIKWDSPTRNHTPGTTHRGAS